MPEYIKQLIAGGESQTLDFKFEVSDFRKIARTLVAFANTDGGRLLVGIKDNGAVAGVRSEEEFYMIEGAARLYCMPEVHFSVKEWQVDRRKVLEVIIARGEDRPYKAVDEEGRWIAYIRQDDQNFKASRIALNVWEKQRGSGPLTIRFRHGERFLLSYLEDKGQLTLSKYRRLAGLTSFEAEAILTEFCLLGIIKIEYSSSQVQFRLIDGYQKILEEIAGRRDGKGFGVY